MATTGSKVGVLDSAPGAGVQELLTLTNGGGMPSLIQPTAPLPVGDPWMLRGAASLTPTAITDTFPPKYVMGYKVQSGKALLFTGGIGSSIGASLEYYRVCRRYFLYGYQGTAAPAAPAAPTVALLGLTDGIGTSGNYTYKVAPIDTFRREGPASVASGSVTLTATNRGVTITPPAAGTGVIGYNIYRTTVAGGVSVWYFVGSTPGATAYLDADPDASLDTSLVPSNTWTTGAITGETMEGAGEIIAEIGAVVLTGVPTHVVYTGPYGGTKQAIVATITNTVGARTRIKPFQEAANFIPVPTATANMWRGPHIVGDLRTRQEEDFGATAVSGFNAAPSAGAIIIWGQQVIGIGQRGADPAAGTAHAYTITPTHPHGVLIPSGGEIVVEIGAVAAGVLGIRDIMLTGQLLPTAAT